MTFILGTKEKMTQVFDKEGLVYPVTVINAGIPGYMSFNQQIFLTSWVMLDKGLKPDVVLSLDGVNDIHFRIAAYMYSLKNKTKWMSAYHGFQQKIDREIREVMTLPGAFRNFMKYLRDGIDRFFPYTVYLVNKTNYKIKSIIIENRLRRELASKKMILSGNNELVLTPEVEDSIISAYKNSVLDLAGACRIRGIAFTSYLQPVHLQKYCYQNIPKINYANDVSEILGWDLGCHYKIDVRSLFEKSDRMYQDLENKFPDNFSSLISLFKKEEFLNKIVFADTVHCTELGSRAIAKAIIKDLIKKNILTVKDI